MIDFIQERWNKQNSLQRKKASEYKKNSKRGKQILPQESS